MLIGIAEADEICMQACTAVMKRRYIVYTQKGNIYEPHKYIAPKIHKKDKRPPRGKRELDKWLKNHELNLTAELKEECTNLDGALWQLKKIIKDLYRLTKCDCIDFWLGPSDGSNFRFKRAKTAPYKGTRGEKPEIHSAVRDYLINVYGAQVIWGHEGDDALGLACVAESGHLKANDNNTLLPISPNTILIHKDKDIFMVPGWHFNTQTGEFEYVEKLGKLWLNADRKIKGRGLVFFYSQLLTGDRVDNIPNLAKGYGDVKVYNLLADSRTEEQMLSVVVSEYKKVLGNAWRDRLLEQADLVWICQKEGQYGSDYIQERLNEMVKT